jgi:simple sugar transport system ATP-binding protein
VAPSLLILDEPTRGIDVGAKAEVERRVVEARARGMAVIFVSTELAEVVRVSDRVVVLAERRVLGELRRGEASEAAIVAMIAAEGGRA